MDFVNFIQNQCSWPIRFDYHLMTSFLNLAHQFIGYLYVGIMYWWCMDWSKHQVDFQQLCLGTFCKQSQSKPYCYFTLLNYKCIAQETNYNYTINAFLWQWVRLFIVQVLHSSGIKEWTSHESLTMCALSQSRPLLIRSKQNHTSNIWCTCALGIMS